MAIQTIGLLLSVLAIWVTGGVDSATHHHAPAPAVDCSGLFLNMADCLSYVTNGSTTTKPEGSCCSGLKTVLKTDAECLCEAFKSSAQFGVVLNITKAVTLPSACHVSAPPLSDCGLSIVPSAAPAISPSGALPPSAAAGGPTSVSGGGSAATAPALAPVPVPGSSGSSAPLAIASNCAISFIILFFLRGCGVLPF